MKRTRLIIAATMPLVLGGLWFYGRAEGSEGPAFRFAAIERADLEAAVSATGNLGAVTTVQVGTQVSGQVSAIHVDFNDRVTRGQLIARIDPTLQEQAVRDALAGFQRAQAEWVQAEREHERNRQLFEARIITQSEFDAIEYRYTVAKAGVTSAQVTVDRARQNLAYTSIHAPIDGIVVERNVDVGQTVAASLSAPQLFLIANDLSRMQILASVDESDIGLIEEGQTARFTVQAYPNEPFVGTVRQVRLQSASTENVVSYTVVVEVENPTGRLLPGMTATVSFITGSAEDALVVPNAALRFRPSEEAMAVVRQMAVGARAADGDSTPARPVARRNGAAAATGGATRPGAARSSDAGTLWYVGDDGTLRLARVRTGITDGTRTVVQGESIEEGMQVIVGSAVAGASASAPVSPFQSQPGGAPRRPGGF